MGVVSARGELRKEHSPAPVLRLPAVQFERVPPALSLGFLCLLEGDTPPPSDAPAPAASLPVFDLCYIVSIGSKHADVSVIF